MIDSIRNLASSHQGILLAITVLILFGCSERRNYSSSNPKERSALTDAQLVDRLKSFKPDHYDDLFDDANDRLISSVAAVFANAQPGSIICVVAVRSYADPRRYLGQEITLSRGYTYVARVKAVSVVSEGLACQLINASNSDGAMPIRVSDSAQSYP